MEEIILFIACLCSFASVLISLLFFLRFKKTFFFHVLLILLTFFLISTNNLYACVHSPITDRAVLCIFGAILSLCFSYGIISFVFDLINISPSATVRKIVVIYSACIFIFAIILIFLGNNETTTSNPGQLLNLLGIWIPTGFSVITGLIFYKRIDKGIFRKEKWMIIVLAVLNLALSFILKSAPFIFFISVSILIYHTFYHFYFSSPITKKEKTLKDDFIKNFSITKREQEIIIALLDGKSNKELANALFISEKTIEAHLANIYKKLGVKNRLELFSHIQNKA